jgi:hypothetical protein
VLWGSGTACALESSAAPASTGRILLRPCGEVNINRLTVSILGAKATSTATLVDCKHISVMILREGILRKEMAPAG